MEQRVLARCHAAALPPSARIVVGFSGGADSLALMGLLARIAPLAGLSVTAVHVDHGLSEHSADDGQRAAEMAGRLGVPFRIERVRGQLRELHRGVGVEEAARRERYLALGRVAADLGTALVAVAHHRDDQAETVLLHLLRGAGLAGAVAMRQVAMLSVPWWTEGAAEPPIRLVLWRPLLDEPREVVRGYASALGLPWIEDPSNADLLIRRNAIRREVLPILECASPGAADALARYARLAAEDDAALTAIAERTIERMHTPAGELSRRELLDEPEVAIQRRVVRLWVKRQQGCLPLSAERVDAILHLALPRDRAGHVEIGGGITVEAVGNVLRLAGAGGSRSLSRPRLSQGCAGPRAESAAEHREDNA